MMMLDKKNLQNVHVLILVALGTITIISVLLLKGMICICKLHFSCECRERLSVFFKKHQSWALPLQVAVIRYSLLSE
jgi:hypothetical protein